MEQQKNIAHKDLQKQTIITAPSSYYSEIDTVFFAANNACYFQSRQQKKKQVFESEWNVTFAYFQQEDTLTIQMLVETLENKIGQLQTDTLICLYKVYPDSLVPIQPENTIPVRGNRMYLRQSGTYRRIAN